ncbi:MAG: AmmeMemoRadiSam system protein A [Epsilonproteobacteria bacterium]|nr:AmmeMemoRadiSam system protein A [Campylobacterota bacterium]
MDRYILLKIAKDAILSEFDKRIIDRENLIKRYPELLRRGAVFVTIKERESLRGCIGSLIAYRPLIDDLIENAKSSAFNDPRFPPLKREDIDNITIEISLLSPYKRVEYRDKDDLKGKIRPKVDGVVLKLNGYQATFLPQVWEEIEDFELFFSYLCQKAGINPEGCLEAHPQIYTYQVEKVE